MARVQSSPRWVWQLQHSLLITGLVGLAAWTAAAPGPLMRPWEKPSTSSWLERYLTVSAVPWFGSAAGTWFSVDAMVGETEWGLRVTTKITTSAGFRGCSSHDWR